jgi:hypothetical protein
VELARRIATAELLSDAVAIGSSSGGLDVSFVNSLKSEQLMNNVVRVCRRCVDAVVVLSVNSLKSEQLMNNVVRVCRRCVDAVVVSFVNSLMSEQLMNMYVHAGLHDRRRRRRTNQTTSRASSAYKNTPWEQPHPFVSSPTSGGSRDEKKWLRTVARAAIGYSMRVHMCAGRRVWATEGHIETN